MALLEVSGMNVFYGAIQALRDINITVESGEAIALLGANGAGKTSTLRTISGMLEPAAGKILFDGDSIAGLSPNKVVERGLAHLPEGRELFASLSVMDNLRAGYWVLRRNRDGLTDALDQAFAYFPRLKERQKQHAGTLSGGEQQMLAVARALMSSPRLLLVDELSLGLAPMIVAQLFEILRTINAAGTAVVIVEQFVHMALANTVRAYVLAKGEIVLQGDSSDLASRPELVASYLGEVAPKQAPATRRPRRAASLK